MIQPEISDHCFRSVDVRKVRRFANEDNEIQHCYKRGVVLSQLVNGGTISEYAK